MKATIESGRLLVAHMLDWMARIRAYTNEGRAALFASPLIQDAVMRNLQTMSESSQRLSNAAEALQPAVP